MIAIVVAVAAALQASTESLGFLFSFGLQAIFFWAIFLYRKQITARLVAATTGAGYDGRMPRMTVVQRAGDVATRPFVALVGMRGRGGRDDTGRQESALAGDPAPARATAPRSRTGSTTTITTIRAPSRSAAGNGEQRRRTGRCPHGHAAPRRRARTVRGEANGNGRPPPQRSGADAAGGSGSRAAQPPSPEHELSPRASHEDAMRRARELRERQRTAADDEADRS